MKQPNLHAYSCTELQTHLKEIEEELKKPINRRTLERLFQRLEIAHQNCLEMKSRCTLSSESFLSDSENKIKSLFGRIVSTHMNSEVDQMLQRALALSPGDLKEARSLQRKLCSFKLWNRPSRENLIKISQIEKKIRYVKSTLLSLQSDINLSEAENLLYLARLVYYKNEKEKNKAYFDLSSEAKEHFNEHLVCLKTTAFAKEKLTIQALFASAFELAGVPLLQYPSSREIKDFFSEEEVALRTQ